MWRYENVILLNWYNTTLKIVSYDMYHPYFIIKIEWNFIQHIMLNMKLNDLSLLMKLIKFTFLEKGTMAKWPKHRQGSPRQEAEPHQDPITQPSNKPAELFQLWPKMLNANRASVTLNWNIQLNYINKSTHKERKRWITVSQCVTTTRGPNKSSLPDHTWHWRNQNCKPASDARSLKCVFTKIRGLHAITTKSSLPCDLSKN